MTFRERAALDLRLADLTYTEIARRLGFANKSSAWRLVRQAVGGNQELLRAIGGYYRGYERRPILMSSGYLIVRAAGHPLVGRSGRVRVHRQVAYDAYGSGPHPCARCGTLLDWPEITIDHINGNRTDNCVENLQLCCGPCNTTLYWERRRGDYPADPDEYVIAAWRRGDLDVDFEDEAAA